MRALFSQFSGLIGILTFVNLLLSNAAIERSLLTAIGAGLAVYVVLSLGDVVIQRILEHASVTLPPVREEGPADEERTHDAAAAGEAPGRTATAGAAPTGGTGSRKSGGTADTLAA